MKKSILLIAIIFLAIFGSNRAVAVELDTVWVSDINGQVLFQHPVSKNILIANNGITELFSNDGKFVRSFPLNTENTLDMSPDGTKMLYYFWEDTKFVLELYDYNTQKVIFKTNGLMPKFLDNNTFVFLLPSDGKQANINKCKTDKFEITQFLLNTNGPVTSLATSPDGKYISFATYEENNGSDSKAYLYLIDAETMKQVKQLGSWDSEGQRIGSIHFSPDSKYLTYNTEYFEINFPILIFHIPTIKVLQNIDRKAFNYSKYVGLDLKLLDSNKYLIKLIGPNLNNRDVDLFLKDIETNQILFQTKYDVYNNIIDFSDYKYFCNIVKQNSAFCFDLKNIMTGIPSTTTLKISYNNKKILMNSIEKPINKISIMTIEGREVYRKNFDRLLNINNSIEIPLELSNGLYLINITSGKDNFVHKLLIKE